MRGRSSACCHSSRVRAKRVQRRPVGAVADRVHGHRQAAGRGLRDAVGQVVLRQQLLARSVQHPCRARPQRAVHERLHRSHPQQARCQSRCAAPAPSPPPAPAAGCSSPPAASAAGRRRSAATARGRPGPGSRAPRSRRGRWPRPCLRAAPASVPATSAGGSGEAPGVPLLEHAGRVLGAGRAQRGAVHPQRVVVVRPQRGRPLAGDLVQRRAVRRRRPARSPPASPCPAASRRRLRPRRPRRRPPPGCGSRAGRAMSRSSAQSRKWTWASVNPGSTQRPSRSIRSWPTVSESPSRTSTPPAISSPATASARTWGRRGSIV